MTPFIDTRHTLSDLHLGYESAKPHVEQKQAGLRKDRSTIANNDHITLRGIPQRRTATCSGQGQRSSE